MQVKARSKVLLFLLATSTQLLNSPVLCLLSELFSFSLNSGRVKHRQSICTPVGSRANLVFVKNPWVYRVRLMRKIW